LIHGSGDNSSSRLNANSIALGSVERFGFRGAPRWARSPRKRWLACAIVLLIVAGALAVGYLASANKQAGSPDWEVILRVTSIVSFIGLGAYAYASRTRARMGLLMVGAGVFSWLWMLNGADGRLTFGAGALLSALAPTVFAFVMLAHPSGRLPSRGQVRFLAIAGGLLLAFWTFMLLANTQPPFRTPMLRCVPHCPPHAFFLGSVPSAAFDAVKALALLSWGAIVIAPPLLIAQRLQSAPTAARRTLVPVFVLASTAAAVWLAFVVSPNGSPLSDTLADIYAGALAVLPVAIFFGLIVEQLFMGHALADLVAALQRAPHADPERLVASALGDPSVKIAYETPGPGMAVDFSGAPVEVPEPDDEHAVTWIDHDGHRVGAIIYDVRLADEEEFVRAAAAVALLRIETEHLEQDLKATARELRASRIRLVEAADNERQRIERDLHDGIQQHLLGLRLKLQMAAETLQDDPLQGQAMIAGIGKQMDGVLQTLRGLARGIYPALLTERGLAAALTSDARRLPIPVTVSARGIAKYNKDVEVAVYFACLEAMQNVVKHGGKDAEARVRLWREGKWLHFEVRDTGVGCEPELPTDGAGRSNMRDRIEAVGGALTFNSQVGVGTVVSGRTPIP
jgi:signal transduction histidine kinase